MEEVSQGAFVEASTQGWESWDDERLRQLSPILWKTLISAGKTNSYGLTMGLCEIPPGKQLIRHRHQEEELYYILAGEGQMEINRQVSPIKAGMAVFIPGNAEHALVNQSPSPLQFVYVFPVDSFQQVQYLFTEVEE